MLDLIVVHYKTSFQKAIVRTFRVKMVNAQFLKETPGAGLYNVLSFKGHYPEMSSTPKNPKISIRTLFFAIYLHQIVQYVVCACSPYVALSEYVTYNSIALIFLSLLRS